MERASASPREGRVRWPGLLLAAALVTCWSSPASAQIAAEAVPPLVAEGESVLLVAHKLPPKLQVIYWYRERVAPDKEIAHLVLSSNTTVGGAASTGRETLLANGSLLLRNASQGDAGPYLINVIHANYSTEQVSVSFQVFPPLPTPTVTSNNSSPTEGEGPVVLTCEPETPNTTYLWRRDGEILSDGDRLQLSDNRTLTLLTVLRADMGSYECETRNPVSVRRSDPLFLNITYGPDAPLISPPDTHFPPGANLSLSCHAASNPPAQYSWLVNGTLQAHSRELFLPNVTTEASGTYACLAHNAATGLNRTAVRNITVLEPVTWAFIEVANTTVKEMDSVLLTCLFNGSEVSIRWFFNGQSLRLTERATLSGDNSTLAIEPVWREDAGDYQCEASNPVSTKRSNPVRLAVIIDPTRGNSGLSGGAIAGIVVGAAAGVALVGALAYFLYFRKTGGGSDQRDPTEHKPSASRHNLGPSDSSPKKVDDVTYSALDFSAQQLKEPTSASPSPSATEIVYSEVKKK